MTDRNRDGGDVFDHRGAPGRKGAVRGSAGQTKMIAEYTVVEGDTLSHIALKFSNHATRPYWTVIYEANKALIGDDTVIIKPGMVLKIPELPANLKDG